MWWWWKAPNALKSEPRIKSLVREADSLRDSGNAREAAKRYAQALELFPDRYDLRVQLGNMAKDSGQFVEAETAYRAAIALRPDDPDVHVQLGHLLKMTGRRSEALSAYRRAIELNPLESAAVTALADAGDPNQLERRFEVQLRAGGADTLLAISEALKSMRDMLDRLSQKLPDALAQTAFPVSCYDTFRSIFPIPVPPPSALLRFHVLLLADRETIPTLFAQIKGVREQGARDWTLTVIGSDAARQSVVELCAVSDPRIIWFQGDPLLPEAEMERRAAAAIDSDWLVLLAQGAVPHRHMLAWIAAAAQASDASAYFFDEDSIRNPAEGPHELQPTLRQTLDRNTLFEANVYGETLAIRHNEFQAIFQTSIDETVSYCRSLLLLEQAAKASVGHIPLPLVCRHAPQATPAADHHRAVMAHFNSLGLVPREAHALPDGRLVLASTPKDDQTRIAAIIGTRDGAADVAALISSLRKTADRPDALDIVVIDNGSAQSADLEILASIRDGATVLRMDETFNWSRLNTNAAMTTDAPYLLFLNDDMHMLSKSWDRHLRFFLERGDVGAVGARLLYYDDTIQHGGMLFGWQGSVIHDGLYEASTTPGPCGRWQLTRRTGAVTGAFLATRRDLFVSMGGFDAADLPVAYSDVDYALRLRAKNLQIIWTPDITLYHHESKTRRLDHTDAVRAARNASERQAMIQRWGAAMVTDPSVNPTWHMASLPFRLLSAPSVAQILQYIALAGRSDPWRPDTRSRT